MNNRIMGMSTPRTVILPSQNIGPPAIRQIIATGRRSIGINNLAIRLRYKPGLASSNAETWPFLVSSGCLHVVAQADHASVPWILNVAQPVGIAMVLHPPAADGFHPPKPSLETGKIKNKKKRAPPQPQLTSTRSAS